jgi:hypothetical protein
MHCPCEAKSLGLKLAGRPIKDPAELTHCTRPETADSQAKYLDAIKAKLMPACVNGEVSGLRP